MERRNSFVNFEFINVLILGFFRFSFWVIRFLKIIDLGDWRSYILRFGEWGEEGFCGGRGYEVFVWFVV